ncbi:hypothetical protein BYT27DRAFT_7239248 [Phlegmacium glaucopus]|nr:hypothetical protein BYT27DRAFT_7239248 [Phlegmacium glaucopus]
MATDNGLPSLSFPAILRNPGLTNRYAHLHDRKAQGDTYKSHPSHTTSIKKNRRDQNEGRRWVRRKDNAHFVGNSHVVVATKPDYIVPPPHISSTFPEPLPPYLPRTVKLSVTPALPVTDPASANAGRFSLSLKGMRRDLRKAGGRAEALIRDVESEMIQWLTLGGTVLAPESRTHTGEIQPEGVPVGSTGTVFEVSRTPLQLIWKISDDAFARYIVHCCARYHEIISFSKGTSDNRLTYLLRPNVTRPDRRAPAALDTPPISDLDYSSNPDTDDNFDSDFVSERELESDIDLDGDVNFALPAIKEASLAVSPVLSPAGDDVWSLVEEMEDDSQLDDLESGSEFESVDILHSGIEALSLAPPLSSPSTQPEDPDGTLTQIRPHPLRDSPSARRHRQEMFILRKVYFTPFTKTIVT